MCMVSNDTFPTCVMFSLSSAIATSDIYSLSLHDALPICGARAGSPRRAPGLPRAASQLDRDAPPRRSDGQRLPRLGEDRKSTRLNSSHLVISYAVFCLKKKKKK